MLTLQQLAQVLYYEELILQFSLIFAILKRCADRIPGLRMATLFTDDKPLNEVLSGLRQIGYDNGLLQENYAFRDYFTSGMQEQRIEAVAFGQAPTDYDSACIGVACVNGVREQALLNRYRSLGAPFILEIDNYEIREWIISSKKNHHGLVERYPIDKIREMFVSRAPYWKPEPLLRAKNIGSFHWTTQLSLFAGLLPELEERIQEKLEPLLHETLSVTKITYKDVTGHEPPASHLFKLIFWLLTAKVFRDRHVPGFVNIGSDPDELLEAVAKQHKTPVGRLLNRPARVAAAATIWTNLDFRHLSVEVLSQMWANMLIDEETKRELGFQRTSRTIVRYIVEHVMPAVQWGDEQRIIFEPCSGSAVFLTGAMNHLRHKHTLFLMNAKERHQYFVKHLAALETDPFGVEISRLALTLADFPNPNNWDVAHADVFEPDAMKPYLQRAGVVFCNPPFASFTEAERERYQIQSALKPVEVLNRVLDDLHPSGVLGFVLPRIMIDGHGYKAIRRRLAERFENLEITILPDRAFEADSEIGLLVATEPIPHDLCRVTHRKVNDNKKSWRQFELQHELSFSYSTNFDVDQAEENLAVPELPEVWEYLLTYRRLKDSANVRRGIQWNKPLVDEKGRETGFRKDLIKTKPEKDFMLGVAPRTKFHVFETPTLYYLSRRSEDQLNNNYQLPWEQPKVIVNKAARSRSGWRMAAFPDTQGLICYQTFIGVWPESNEYDVYILSAILNGPLANAFIATREGKSDITTEILDLVPLPYFTEYQRAQVKSLTRDYRDRIGSALSDNSELNDLLMKIDAIILDAYMLPPELENQLLCYFQGHGEHRRTTHKFSDYLPPNCEVYFSLSDHLSPEFKTATAGELLRRAELG